MLRQDVISRALLAITVVLTLFLYLFVGLEPLITPILLLAGSVVLRVYTHARGTSETVEVESDAEISPQETRDITKYALYAVLGLLVGSVAIDNLYAPVAPSAITALASTIPFVTTAFTILMAVSEEQYFRGELFRLFSRWSPAIAISASAVLFMVYHFYVYGTSSESMLYVLVGGLLLAWAGWKTKRLSTPMLAHIANNLVGTVLLVPAIIIIGVFLFLSLQRRKNLWNL